MTGAITTIQLTAAEVAKVIADSAPTAAQIKQSEINQAREDLEDLERASLRDAIAYIAAKADAPVELKAQNLAAIALIEEFKKELE